MNCKHESTQTNFYVPQLFVYEWHKNNFFDMSSGMSDGLLDFGKVLMCPVVSARVGKVLMCLVVSARVGKVSCLHMGILSDL